MEDEVESGAQIAVPSVARCEGSKKAKKRQAEQSVFEKFQEQSKNQQVASHDFFKEMMASLGQKQKETEEDKNYNKKMKFLDHLERQRDYSHKTGDEEHAKQVNDEIKNLLKELKPSPPPEVNNGGQNNDNESFISGYDSDQNEVHGV